MPLRFPWARKTRSGSFLLVHEEQLSPPDNVVTGLLATLNDVIAVRESIADRDRSGPRAPPASEEDAVSELDRLEAAMAECREMIREAHAATKDLRAAVREAKQELRGLAHDEVAAHIQVEVSRQLEDLGDRTREAVTAATQKVIAEFDRFGESLLGKETYWQKASGRRAGRSPRHRCGAARHPSRRRQWLMR